MKKYVSFGLVSVTLFIIIFILIFAKDKKNAATVKENITQIKSGMSILEVRKLLTILTLYIIMTPLRDTVQV